ncbi:hypothetical protein [Achromobacter xylosoxidans]|uniref:hypothetical protein n=1 Tax=Alcaligenes xylosoxydans xylosoxydans TaxID=85698 RepID=UPI0012374DBA|nr:hypothetical protein [Achromobacter xylosoxidans]
MDIDDNGNERRNALLVSALLFSAAYLELKLPSFIAEYIKLEIAPAAQFKVWVLAALLAFYVAMRYRFSASRAVAIDHEREAFASTYLRNNVIASESNECRADAYTALLELPGMKTAARNGLHFGTNQIEPIRIGLDTGQKLLWVQWRLADSLRTGEVAPLGKYDPVTASRLKVYRPVLFILHWCFRQVFWSRKAWEVNPVYFACFVALYFCLKRASNLAGGWATLLQSFF